MSIMDLGTLHSIGYADRNEAARVERIMRNPRALLIDIRYSPRSRWYPAWNRKQLSTRYGERYIWEQRLGNVNYQHRECGIQLADGHQDAIRMAASHLAHGTSLVLLCACKHAHTCHRSIVAKLIQDAMIPVHEGVQV